MKRTILFVDDEPNVLAGLSRMLRPMRALWDMHFAASGAEALAIMAREPVDAVVSDMRMPGMDGPELLRRIQRDYPLALRFALSGYSDQEMVGRSIAPTHQYLTKPCDAALLVASLQQALDARDLVPNKELLVKLSRIEHLPVLPEVYHRISAELAKGEPSPKVIGDIVAADVSMSANLLKLVNSAYFGLPRHIATPQQAVIILGVGVIRSVILTMHLFNSFSCCGSGSISLPLLWGHSMRTGAMARTIAQLEGLPREQEDHASIAGLLHDMGKLLLESHCPELYCDVLDAVRAQNRRVADVEAEMLGMTHAEAGAYLLGLWGLPPEVVRAVAGHHSPAGQTAADKVAQAVYFANLLDHDIFVFHEHYARPEADPERLAAAGGPTRYQAWKKAILQLGLGREEA